MKIDNLLLTGEKAPVDNKHYEDAFRAFKHMGYTAIAILGTLTILVLCI